MNRFDDLRARIKFANHDAYDLPEHVARRLDMILPPNEEVRLCDAAYEQHDSSTYSGTIVVVTDTLLLDVKMSETARAGVAMADVCSVDVEAYSRTSITGLSIGSAASDVKVNNDRTWFEAPSSEWPLDARLTLQVSAGLRDVALELPVDPNVHESIRRELRALLPSLVADLSRHA